MNIKGLGQNIFPLEMLKRVDRKRTEQAHDRDPGQGQGDGGGQPSQHRLTEEELAQALARLKEIPGVKEANFQFRVERQDDRITVFVEEPDGKIVRRLSDNELWNLLKSTEPGTPQKKGNLLNKAM